MKLVTGVVITRGRISLLSRDFMRKSVLSSLEVVKVGSVNRLGGPKQRTLSFSLRRGFFEFARAKAGTEHSFESGGPMDDG